MNDLKFAFRQLLKNPGFTAVAVLTLALGIGGSTAVFSLINTVILRPLPFPDPERLVLAWTTVADSRTARSAYGSYADWKEQCRAFEDLAIYDGFSCILTGAEASEKINATRVSASFFSVLRASPLLGRTFTEEEANQRARVVVVSHGFWQRRFAGDSNILGRTIEIDGQAAAIVGVMPEQSDFLSGDSDLWQLQSPEQPVPRGAGPWFVLGRLKEGQSLNQAQAELQSVAGRLAAAYPSTNRDLSARVVPLSEEITGPNLRRALWILFGAVACVLLIGCSNLANLLLVRGVARRRELATRLALGASPLRVARQLVVECLPIGMLGGLAGVALALLLIRLVRPLAGTRIPRLADVGLDPVVMGFALALHMELHARTGMPPLALPELVRRESHSIDKSVAVYGGGTMERRIGASLFERKFQASLLAAFSTVALLLAAIGTYGIVHFSVQQRTREIGVRMALGAQKLDVLSVVMSEGLKLVLIGVGLGVLLALSITRLMQRLLFDVTPTDPLTFAAVALLLGGIALFACWLPARRAAKIHPMEALRHQ